MEIRISQINQELLKHLPSTQTAPELLHQAMHYAVMSGGKRIRPMLVYAVGELLGLAQEKCHLAACAIEYIHSYSLVHDDLPGMDDDDFRRNKPTCHKAYDEATAILVGDALQAQAFYCLSQQAIEPQRVIASIQTLCVAIGSQGMCGGQALDLSVKLPSSQQLAEIHHLKTGCLITCACLLSADIAGVDKSTREKIRLAAKPLGLAFQRQDDCFDEENTNYQSHKKNNINGLYEQALVSFKNIHPTLPISLSSLIKALITRQH